MNQNARLLPLCLFGLVIAAPLWLHGDEADQRARSHPTSQTTTSQPNHPMQRKVALLVKELGSPDFRRREQAWKLLQQMGESAIPSLVPFFDHENLEIRRRIGSLIQRPTDPVIRIDAAIALIVSGDPRWMEKGVYMIFEDPITDYPNLKKKFDQMTGLEQAVLAPVEDQLKGWKKTTERYLTRQEKWRAKNEPQKAARETKMHKETKFYEAEAAYWQARDAYDTWFLDEETAKLLSASVAKPTTSQPAASNGS